jgi:hypothetical protein
MYEEQDEMHPCRHLLELLLAYLRAADAPRWPGADGLTIEDVLRSYSQAAAAGLVPDLPSLLASHPELDDALSRFFADAVPIRPAASLADSAGGRPGDER